MSKKLYVGNLAFQTTNMDLQQLFGQAGTVESAQIIEDRDTGQSKGFAFVEMSTEAEASAAIDQFNGKEVGGRMLKVNEAKPRENRSGGGGGGGRNFGGNRGGYGGNRSSY
jgi:cold-inducible RNA-binding protein